jgi:hypothetical protein
MFNLPFDPHKPIVGTATIIIHKSINQVFDFVGEHFFENYPKWATDLIEFEPLDGNKVFIGAKARQLRLDQGKEIKSIFQINDYQPLTRLGVKGVTADYRDYFQLENFKNPWTTKLTYTFELLNVEIFMRPFEKLIRIAIEDGAETTTENIKNLLATISVTS